MGIRLCHELDRYLTLHLGKELMWVCRQQLSADQPYATLLLTTLLLKFFLALCYTQCLQLTEAECLSHTPLFPLCRETGCELQMTFAAICAVVQHTFRIYTLCGTAGCYCIAQALLSIVACQCPLRVWRYSTWNNTTASLQAAITQGQYHVMTLLHSAGFDHSSSGHANSMVNTVNQARTINQPTETIKSALFFLCLLKECAESVKVQCLKQHHCIIAGSNNPRPASCHDSAIQGRIRSW